MPPRNMLNQWFSSLRAHRKSATSFYEELMLCLFVRADFLFLHICFRQRQEMEPTSRNLVVDLQRKLLLFTLQRRKTGSLNLCILVFVGQNSTSQFLRRTHTFALTFHVHRRQAASARALKKFETTLLSRIKSNC